MELLLPEAKQNGAFSDRQCRMELIMTEAK